MTFEIVRMQHADWSVVRDIYAEGLATKLAAFRSEVPEWNEWDADHLSHSRLVARIDNRVLGWAALAPVSGN